MKIMSRGDEIIRRIMIDHCYYDAGEDAIKSNACDVFEQDLLPMIWKALPFHKIARENTRKYC